MSHGKCQGADVDVPAVDPIPIRIELLVDDTEIQIELDFGFARGVVNASSVTIFAGSGGVGIDPAKSGVAQSEIAAMTAAMMGEAQHIAGRESRNEHIGPVSTRSKRAT